ncbi:unnamed protein product [Clonostachys solani]|uniref:DUF4470 domain-containing protein n=1 Tax=Clonostachys solani TaxID=160281 RepID=A0A9N9ZLD4_9HYPO|nr:unnamed protein product [Clonostachys solani]
MESRTPAAADEARQRGNNLYKQGKLRRAATAYLEAARVAPDDARPLFNLAAVYYELAEYTKCADTCRAALLLLEKDGGEVPADKTRIRLCKALLFSQKTDEAKDVLSQVTSGEARKMLELLPARASISPQPPSSLLATRKKLLDRVPRYRTVLQDEPEFYCVGHDDARSFFTEAQLKNGEDLACLCCGIGDARLLYATLIITATLAGMSPSRKKLHFTLVDLKSIVFARDLVIFRMLFDFQTQTEKQREETTIAIAYVFAAQLMPSWASDILHGAMAAVIAELENLSSNVMGIFYVPEPARQIIARVLKEWQQPPEPWYTTAALRGILSRESKLRDAERTSIVFGDMEPTNEKVPPGCGKHDPDTRTFFDIHVLLPPADLMQKYDPRLADIHKAYGKKQTRKNRKVLDDYLDSNWKPNVTVIDLEFQRKREDRATGGPNITWSPHQIVSQLFPNFQPQAAQCPPGVLSHFQSFFNMVGKSIPRLKSRLVIEVVLGEMNDALERLRYGLLRHDQKPVENLDPSKFPDKFDNIDLSNVPDYVGGSLTTFLHGIPLLREERKSLLRSYVLRNTPAWETHGQFLAEYLVLSDRERIESHFRTSLNPSSKMIEKQYDQVRVGPGGIVMVVGFEWHGTSSPASFLPAKTRMTRPELEHWLHSHFLKLCLPYPRVRFDPMGVLAPLNLTAFLHLIAHVASLGYPLHWLSATLAALCGGMLARTRAGPPAASITDEKLAGETYPPADVSVAPFAAEFRTLLAMWEPVLGIPLVWDTAAGDEPLLPELTMIRRYTIRFPATIWDSSLMNSVFSVVIKPQSLKVPSNHLARLLDDRGGDPSPTARGARRAPRIHLISACKWTSNTKTMEFWMDERTIDGLLAEKGWEAWIWRTDSWESVLGPLSLDKGALVKNEAWS